jgi:hypothetical protein
MAGAFIFVAGAMGRESTMATRQDCDHPPTAADEVFCPECGYDLRAIPENRCPECGFGYEHAAIRAIAASRADEQIVVRRRIVGLAVVALVAATLANADVLSRSAPGRSLLHALGVGLGCLELWLVCCTVFWSSVGVRYWASPWLLLVATLLLPPSLLLGLAVPELARLALLAILVAIAWTVRLLPTRFPRAGLSLSACEQARVRRWDALAWVGMVAAVITAILSWS